MRSNRWHHRGSGGIDALFESIRTWLERGFVPCGLATLLAVASAAASLAHSQAQARFDIRAHDLADALDRFGEQSGLQVVYDPAAIEGRHAPVVSGELQPDEVLRRLLTDSDLRWRYVNDKTVLVGKPDVVASSDRQIGGSSASSATGPPAGPVARLSLIEVREDPRRILPNEASDSSFGFSKQLLDTPRSVSLLSEETIDLFGLSAVEDLVSMAPGVFTTTRFGIQGSVDVRAVPADTFFRGMRRLSLQGNGRSVLAAMDTIEVVGGPPSPIYGMGKIGGYTNVVPKSGRAQSGGYLTSAEGFVQAIAGEYQRRELSFGMGGPLTALERFDRRGGYYVYGLGEDSGSFAAGVPIKQQVLQAAVSIDDFVGPLRLEAGTNYQESRTAGALTGRFTQDLVDTGRYIRGTPLIDLDANGNGSISYLEMQSRSPVAGRLNPGNQPLLQTWAWPTDANGRPLPLNQMPVVPGIPQAMYDYLVAHPEADPTGLLRAQGPGGPVPISGAVPLGMVLDPRTTGYDTLDLHRAAAYEKDLKAQFLTAYFDLIYDVDPAFTIKNQLFFDRMHQYKNSNQPFAQRQDVQVIEDKLTVTRRWANPPPWLQLNVLASLNLRNTTSSGAASAGNDFSSHRTDAMAPTWLDDTGGMTPNTTFASPLEDSSLETGLPWGTLYRSEYSEAGLGVLFDIDLWSRINVLAGSRFDRSHASNVDYASSFNPVAGTSAQPGAYYGTDQRAAAWDDGVSWSVSVSYALPHNVRPYVTLAQSSIVLDASNNQLTNAVIAAGHIGSARLKEIGIKASLFDEKLFVALAAYEQARIDVDIDDPSALLTAYPTATRSRGWTAELKWVPTRNMFLSCYAMNQVTRFDPDMGSNQLVDARMLGFQDVLDAQGNVIYPAEAFLYGGRSRVVLPDNVPGYDRKQGNPETQIGLGTSYQWNNGLGVSFSGNYFSSVCTGRLCTVRLPASYVANAGAFVEAGRWMFKLDVSNLFDERYFRARTGDTLGNVLAQAMPDRRWQFTIKTKF